ncbi:MAG: 3-deoxy-D-manno-octulosonate 8-phosphate phosphatase (KDO 8-P phosphatase) [Candidatus Paceibacteria bacterium]
MTSSEESLPLEALQRLTRTRLFALDIDGTLTNGQVTYIGKEESQSFDVLDGQGLVWMRRDGVKLAWISGRGCAATRKRAEELGVEFIVLECKNKSAALVAIQEELGLSPQETLAMGDDLPDLALANGAGFFAAPANARPELLERADYVTESRGGDGAVREVCELYLRARGQWQALQSAAGR